MCSMSLDNSAYRDDKECNVQTDRYAIQALMYFDYLHPPYTAHQMKQKPTILHYDDNEREWPI